MDPQINPYETEKALSEYLSSFYFDPENPLLPASFQIDLHYPQDYLTRLASVALHAFQKITEHCPLVKPPLTALDIGCGVGRLSFELSRYFDRILGIDYSHSFVKACQELKSKGFIEYKRRRQGDNFESKLAKVPENTGIQRDRVDFEQGDAENLRELGQFDLIVASNLIDRLQNPLNFLRTVDKLLKKKGVFLLTSPYTWMEEYTKKDLWIGGKDGKDTFSALRETMEGLGFVNVEELTLKLLIPEHERKLQLCLPHVTVWTRREDHKETE